jgi:acyl-CoA thioester hydrolase
LTQTIIRVRFAETDQMGVAHHSSYILWCEVARVDWLNQHGKRYKDFELETGISLAVSDLHIQYRQAVSFDDEVLIETKLTQAKSRRFTFDYCLMHKGKLVARAKTLHTPTNRAGQAVRMPQAHFELLASHLETQ